MDDSDTNLVILEDAETVLYGHSLVKNAERFSKDKEVMVVTGVSYLCYIAYLYLNFPTCKGAQEAWASAKADGTCRYDLLEAIDDNVDLSIADVHEMDVLEQKKETHKLLTASGNWVLL
jgi:hypothetical protein